MLVVVEAGSIAGKATANLLNLKIELKYKSHHTVKCKIQETLEKDAYFQFSKKERQ